MAKNQTTLKTFFKIITTCLFVLITKFSFSQGWCFASPYGYNESIKSFNLISDSNGNFYIAGSWDSGEIDLGSGTIFKNDPLSESFFVAKYNNSGVLIWANQGKAIGGGVSNSPLVEIDRISLDANGNLYVVGLYSTTLTYPSSPPLATTLFSQSATFFARFSPDGKNALMREVTHTGIKGEDDLPGGIDVDNLGNIFISGVIQSPSSFGTLSGLGGITLNTINNGPTMYVAKFSSAGTIKWVRAIGPNQGGFDCNDISVNPTSGDAFIVGCFSNSTIVDKEQIILTSKGGNDIIIASYDTNGNFRWVKQVGSSSDENGLNIETDDNGNSFITGIVSAPCDFSGIKLSPTQDATSFLARYDANGNMSFAKLIGGKLDRGLSLEVFQNKQAIYMSGEFIDITATFDNFKYTNSNGSSYVVKHLATGEHSYLAPCQRYPQTSIPFLDDVAADNQGNCYVSARGLNASKAEFGGFNLSFDKGSPIVAKICFAGPVKPSGGAIINSLEVYPNPASDKLSFKLNTGALQGKKIQIRIFDSNERPVYVDDAIADVSDGESFDRRIDIKNLHAGAYVLKVLYGNDSYQAHFTKQ